MVNEQVLLESLVALTETSKAQIVMIAGIGSEVAALRETVRALDPTFDDVLAKKREENSFLETARQAVRLLDDAVMRLKADLIQ